MAGRGKKKISQNNINHKWNFALYTRRSFDDLEKEESYTIQNQKMFLNEYLSTLENIDSIQYYTDDGYTGTNFDRPGFQEMLSDIKSGKINAIIVKDLSRLGRDYIGTGKYIEKVFPLYNLRIVSINDNVDSHVNPESIRSLVVPVKNLMNESYSHDLSKKVSSAYMVMAKSGKYVSGIAPYGYELDKEDKHHLVINEKESIIVKKIFKMALCGDGKIKICKYLNDNRVLCRKEIQRRTKMKLSLDPDDEDIVYCWSTSTIGRMLSNETYIGNLVQLKTYKRNFKDKRELPKNKEDWVIYKNAHEPIITEEEFNKVQKLISKRVPKKRKKSEISIYNGIIKCGDCGRAMVKQEDHRGNRNVSNYYCGTYTRLKKSCSKHKIKTELLDKLVLETIQIQIKLVIELEKSLLKLNFFTNKEKIEEEHKKIKAELENKINNLKKYKKSQYEEWKFGNIEKKDFLNISDEVEKQIKAINEEMEMINSTYIEKLKLVKKNDSWINHYKKNKKIKVLNKQVINELIESIEIFEEDRIKINFKYQTEFNTLHSYLEQKEEISECVNGVLQYI